MRVPGDGEETLDPGVKVSGPEPEPGQRVGNYDLEAVVGSGGWGTVYRARHVALDRRVAIKLLKRALSEDAEALARFVTEARAASAVDSPHVVEVIDFAVTDAGQPYIVLEWLEGADLAETLVREKRLPAARAVAIAHQVAEGLAAAHAAGIVHRDLKPGNVFLAGERVKVLDFGIAKLVRAQHAALTSTGRMLGTPSYMSPEQCAGARHVDARTDVYSLGVVLYEMLTGSRPFDAEGPGELIAQHLTVTPRPPRELEPSVPDDVEALVVAMLAKDPGARPQSMAECRDALARLGGIAPAERAVVVPVEAMPDAGTSWGRWALLGAVLTVGGIAWSRWTTAPPPPAPPTGPVNVVLASQPEGARVWVRRGGGPAEPAGLTPAALTLDRKAGEVAFELVLEGHFPARRALQPLDAPGQVTLKVELEKKPPEPAPATAAAPPEPATGEAAEAADLEARAQKLLADGKHVKAGALLSRAYQLTHAPALLLRTGDAYRAGHEQTKDPALAKKAGFFYAAFLRLPAERTSEDDRTRARTLAATLEEQANAPRRRR